MLDAVVARRRAENERFARRLTSWTTAPLGPETRRVAGVVAVEDVAGEVLSELAAHSPLLFVGRYATTRHT